MLAGQLTPADLARLETAQPSFSAMKPSSFLLPKYLLSIVECDKSFNLTQFFEINAKTQTQHY